MSSLRDSDLGAASALDGTEVLGVEQASHVDSVQTTTAAIAAVAVSLGVADAGGAAAAATNALAGSLGTAARAQLSDIQAYVQAQVAAGVAAANAYTDAHGSTVPAAPTIGTATPTAGQISQPFTAGATGGSTILDFTATAVSSDGGVSGSATGASSPIVIPGLTAGTHYTVTVKARNAIGSSAASSASSSVLIPAASGAVNRNQPYVSTSAFNTVATGTETLDDAAANQLLRFVATGNLLTGAMTATVPGVGANIPMNATPIPGQNSGNTTSQTHLLIDTEEIIVHINNVANPRVAVVVQRGANSSVAASHAIGAPVNMTRHGWISNGWPTYYSKTTDPTWTLTMPDFIAALWNRNRPAQTFTGIHAPAGMVPSSDSDAQLELIDPVSGTYFNVWQASVDAANHVVTSNGPGWATGNAINGTGLGTLVSSGGNNAGTRAANSAIGIGAISGYDIGCGRVTTADATHLTDTASAGFLSPWDTNCFTSYSAIVTSGSVAGKNDIWANITANTGTQLVVDSWKKVSDNSAASPPPTGASYWITNSARTIKHALAILVGYGLLDNSISAYKTPATAADTGGHSGPYKTGERWLIPPGTAKPSGLSIAGDMIFTALLNYGMYDMDWAGSSNIEFAKEATTQPNIVSTAGPLAPVIVFWGDGYGSGFGTAGYNNDAGPNWDGVCDFDKIVPLLRHVTP